MQREIGVFQRLVVGERPSPGTLAGGIRRRRGALDGHAGHAAETAVSIREAQIAGARIHLVGDAVVRTTGEMTSGTGHAITAGLLVPEQRLAEQQRILPIGDDAREARQRHVVGLQAAEGSERVLEWTYAHLSRLILGVQEHADRSGGMGDASQQGQGVEHRQQAGGGFAKVHGASWEGAGPKGKKGANSSKAAKAEGVRTSHIQKVFSVLRHKNSGPREGARRWCTPLQLTSGTSQVSLAGT